ncbi:MAG: hypothetical protein Q4C53_01540 [Clostridia bacterium]|nr:hypothetical protein [Clostridia bacterium]
MAECAHCNECFDKEDLICLPDGDRVCEDCFDAAFEETRGDMEYTGPDPEEIFSGAPVDPGKLAEWFDFEGTSTADGMTAEIFAFHGSVLFDDADAMEALGADESFVEDFLMYFGLDFEVALYVHEDRILFASVGLDEESPDPTVRCSARGYDLSVPAAGYELACNLISAVIAEE